MSRFYQLQELVRRKNAAELQLKRAEVLLRVRRLEREKAFRAVDVFIEEYEKERLDWHIPEKQKVESRN